VAGLSLYITADAIGTPTGGGKVTFHESAALAAASSGDAEVWQFPHEPRPWEPDAAAVKMLKARPDLKPARAHFYAGTFTQTIELLRDRGTRVTYTCAAHDINASREEHARLGFTFDYPHLTDPHLWQRYVRGYVLADAVVCPSDYSAALMRTYGCQNVSVIPHGYDPPASIAQIPSRFVVGYLGQPGPDKGLAYLLRAWDAWSRDKPDTLLLVGGRGTLAVLPWVRENCPNGSFHFVGEVAAPRDVYDACCVYSQSSVSEGFGCEVLEARAHGRPVICSDGAGAHTFANTVVPARNIDALVAAFDTWHTRWRQDPQALIALSEREAIGDLTWDKIRERYQAWWLA